MKGSNRKQSQVSKYIQSFYTEEIHRLIHSYPRERAWFISLIGIKYLLVFIFSVSQNLDKLVNYDNNFDFLQRFGIVGYLDRDEMMQDIIYLLLCINGIFVIIICFSFGLFYYQSLLYKSKISQSMHKLGVSYYIEEGLNDKKTMLNKIFSFLITIYQYCGYVPSIFLSLGYIHSTSAGINLVITILLNLLLSDCDYNYEIQQIDYLARPFSSGQFFFTAFVETSIFFAIALVPNGQSAITAAYFLISGVCSHISSQYYNHYSHLLYLISHSFFFCCSIVVQIGISFSIPNKLISFFFIVFFSICYKLSEFVMKQSELKTLQDLQDAISEKYKSTINLDRVMRLDLFGEIINQRDNEKRDLRILNLIVNSHINFQNSSFTPVEEVKVQKLQKKKELQKESTSKKKEKQEKNVYQSNVDDRTGYAIIKQRIKQIFKEQFKKSIKEKKRNKEGGSAELLNFFVFLIEIADSHRIYWLQYLEVSMNKRLSIKQIQLLNSVHSIFLKKRQILRQTMGRTNPFDTSYLEVIVFEKRLEQSYMLFDETIKQKLEILNIMKQKEITVTQLTSKIEKMQSLVQELRRNLNSLCLMNDDSLDLLNIQALYLENIAFNEKDINLMQINKYRKKRSARLRHRYLNHINDDDIVSSSINSDRFDEKTCIVFATYKDPRNLIINTVSQNFQDIFYFTTNVDILGHNIESIIPATFQNFHNKYLEMYLEEEITTSLNELLLQSSLMDGQDDSTDDKFKDKMLDQGQAGLFDKNEDQSTKGVTNQALSLYQRGCRMNQQIIFSQLSPLFILPVRIDIRTNFFQDNDTFGLSAKIKHINDQFEYILYDERNLNILGLTEKLHFNVFPHCESLSKMNMKKLFPFLIGTLDSNNTSYKNGKEILSNNKIYHVNLTQEMEDIIKESQLKKNNQNKKRKIAFIIIQLEDFKHTMTSTTTSVLTKKSSVKQKTYKPLKSTYVRADLSSYNFTFIELTLNRVKYRGVENVSYIEISKLRQLNPNDQAPFILSQIKNPKKSPIYEQLFSTSNELERIISDLEQKVITLHQYQLAHPSQLTSSLQIASGMNLQTPQYLSNNQISTNGSSINNLLPQQFSSLQLLQQQQDKQILLIDDSSNLEQAKIRLSNNNIEQEIINEQEEDDNSLAGNDGFGDMSNVEKKQKIKFQQIQNHNQNHHLPVGNQRQNSIENHQILLQQGSLQSQDQKFLHSFQEIQYIQDEPMIGETQYNNSQNKFSIYNNIANPNYSTGQILYNQQYPNEKTMNQETSLINLSQSNVQTNQGVNDERFNGYNNSTFNDQSQMPFNKQVKYQQNVQHAVMSPHENLVLVSPTNIQSLVSPSNSENMVNIVFNSPVTSQMNINTNTNLNYQQQTTAPSQQQDFKFFSPRVTVQSAQNLIELDSAKNVGGQNNNRFISRAGFDTLLSPAISDGQFIKFDQDSKLSPTGIKLSPLQVQTGMDDKQYSNIHINNPHFDSQLAPRLSNQPLYNSNVVKRDDEYYSNSSPFGINLYNTKDDKASKKKKVQEIQFDIASTNSKDSSSASAKRQLQQIMADKSILQVIKAMNLIGIICFATMVCVTWVQYIQLNQQITSTYEDYQVFNWPTKYESTLSQIFKYQNMLYLTQYSKSLKFATMNDYYAFRNTTTQNKYFNKDIVNSLIRQMESANVDRQIFSLLRNHYLTFLIGQYYDLSNLTKTSSVPSVLVAVKYNSTVQFAIVMAFQHVFRYTVGLGGSRPEYYMIANQMAQISTLKDIQNEQLTNQQNQEISIQNNLTSLMILIIVINAVCVGIIIPLYYHIQKERDVIIQLFATFPTSKIDQLTKDIQKSYFNQKSMSIYSNKNSQSLKQTIMALQNSQREKDLRKQNISTITKLPRFNSRIIICIFVIYIFIICYPIINKVVIQQYLSKSTLDLQTMTNVYQLRSYLLENIGMHMNILVMKVNPTFKPMNATIYYSYLNDLNNQQQSINNVIQWLVNQEYESTRYAQSEYSNFFFSAFQNNLCDVFNQYPQYNTNSTVLNTTICDTTYQGFLKKGLQVAYKQVLTLFPTLYNMYTIADTAQSLAQINNFLSTFNIADFILYTEFLDQVIISLTEFVLDQNRNYYNDIIIFQIALISYQMVLMFLVFAIGWISFSSYLNNSLHQTKTYLQIIDINSLIENSYILTYIKKNSII